MKLILNDSPSRTIPMNKMKPGQFAWCESEKTIVFATWRAGQTDQPSNNFVGLNNDGQTFHSGSPIPVQLLPPGTQFTLED